MSAPAVEELFLAAVGAAPIAGSLLDGDDRTASSPPSTPTTNAARAPDGAGFPVSARVISVLAFATMFAIDTDTFLAAPLLPTLSRSFHVHTDVSGWMVSACALGYALFALVAGPLSDGRDRRRVPVPGGGMSLASLFHRYGGADEPFEATA